MSYALINSSGEKDYHSTVLNFLEEIENDKVRGVVMVAMTDVGPFLNWNCTPEDMAAMSACLQAEVTMVYMKEMCDDSEDD